jgi:hypothetical protein
MAQNRCSLGASNRGKSTGTHSEHVMRGYANVLECYVACAEYCSTGQAFHRAGRHERRRWWWLLFLWRPSRAKVHWGRHNDDSAHFHSPSVFPPPINLSHHFVWLRRRRPWRQGEAPSCAFPCPLLAVPDGSHEGSACSDGCSIIKTFRMWKWTETVFRVKRGSHERCDW